MKTKVAMAISLAGVLAAGTAAALVNTQVLNGGSSAAGLSADSPQNQQTVPDGAVTVPGTVPSSAALEPQGDPSPTQAVYAVGDAGTVTLETANDVLTIVAATPSPGWFVTEAEGGDSRVEVKFQSATTEIEFHANLLYGVVNTSVEGHDLTTSPSVSGEDEHEDDDGLPHMDDDDDDHHGGDDDDD
jgi:hypothetical protein